MDMPRRVGGARPRPARAPQTELGEFGYTYGIGQYCGLLRKTVDRRGHAVWVPIRASSIVPESARNQVSAAQQQCMRDIPDNSRPKGRRRPARARRGGAAPPLPPRRIVWD